MIHSKSKLRRDLFALEDTQDARHRVAKACQLPPPPFWSDEEVKCHHLLGLWGALCFRSVVIKAIFLTDYTIVISIY